MSNIFKIWLLKLHTWLNKLLIKHVDISESNDVVKVVTKKFGITWIDMVNHVEITNKFFVPYKLMEVKLTYYNDANQNIGYLHFNEPTKIKAYSKKVVEMPAKMSNITAIFNMVRLMITDDIKTRTVGTSTIRILGINFEFPIDDIMVIDKDKVILEEEEDRKKRLEAKLKREEERLALKKEREEKRKMRLDLLSKKRAAQKEKIEAKIKARKEKIANKKAARARLKRMKDSKLKSSSSDVKIEEQPIQDKIKAPQENPAALDNSSNV